MTIPVDPAKRSRNRIAFGAAVLATLFGVVGLRMAQVMALPPDESARRAYAELDTQISRPDIVDRNGVLLATDLPVASVYADPRDVWDAAETARALVSVFPELDAADLERRLKARTGFIWVKRAVSPRQHAAVHALGLPGIGFRSELKRYYPAGRLAAHVLGYVDLDNKGLAGVERSIDGALKDRLEPGAPVALAIDSRAQHVLMDELQATVDQFSAIGAAAIVMDVHTGEIVAMASLPDFDPNDPGDPTTRGHFNFNTLGVFEMGSTFKAFNTAMALDSGRIGLDTIFDARHPIRIGRHTINDFKPKSRMMSVAEIFEHSSNIGSVKMAESLGRDYQRAFLAKLGQLSTLDYELPEPERGAPLLPRRWGEVEMMTISFGHGIAVSPVHVVTGISALSNGGMLMHPTLLRRDAKAAVEEVRVIRPETSAQMNRLMRLTVEKGTARKADVPGYPVGGKTGTAEKSKGGGYARKALLSSFVGIFPADAPRYAILVMVDEPKGTKETGGYATGGWTAAPATSRIVARIAPLLGLKPNLPPVADDEEPSQLAETEAAMLAQDH